LDKGNIMDPELGAKYRDIILAPGGSRDSDESLRDFLNRDPNDKAFMIQNGFDS
jgi:Zn-dependent oligopeptidase